jgi:nucleoside-diphosphate-sugar epimerase
MKIVVLGGNRFIGPYLVRLLAEQGHELTVVHRGETEAELPSAVKHVHVPYSNVYDGTVIPVTYATGARLAHVPVADQRKTKSHGKQPPICSPSGGF